MSAVTPFAQSREDARINSTLASKQRVINLLTQSPERVQDTNPYRHSQTAIPLPAAIPAQWDAASDHNRPNQNTWPKPSHAGENSTKPPGILHQKHPATQTQQHKHHPDTYDDRNPEPQAKWPATTLPPEKNKNRAIPHPENRVTWSKPTTQPAYKDYKHHNQQPRHVDQKQYQSNRNPIPPCNQHSHEQHRGHTRHVHQPAQFTPRPPPVFTPAPKPQKPQ